MFPSIPGSKRDRNTEPDDPTAAGLSSGRFTEAQLAMMNELIAWWSYRRGQNDAADPLTSLIGGVDVKGTARSIGLTPAAADFDRPLAPSGGAALWIMAYGIPDPPTVGEVYSLTALCHFYDAAGTWLARETITSRTPAATTSTEARAVLDGSTGLPAIQIVGVAGLTIDWTVEAMRVEL